MSEEITKLILYRLDELKADTQEIKEHAKYTNGKVAEVMQWKLKNEGTIDEVKNHCEEMQKYKSFLEGMMDTGKSIKDRLIAKAIDFIVFLLAGGTGFVLVDKIIK
jgi:predicted nuclease with TOPRIM domain